VQQTLHVVEIFFVKQLSFILAIMMPTRLVFTSLISDCSLPTVTTALNGFIKKAKSRNFDIQAVLSDGEGAIQEMIPELHSQGISIIPAGSGAHVPVAERYIQTIKGRVRSFEHSFPYVMTRTLLIYCVLFCASAMNPPTVCFTGRRLNMATDLHFGFGDYVQATFATTDNTMKTRTEGCIALLYTCSSSGNVRMLHLATDRVVTRDQFKTIPMPDLVIAHLTAQASRQGYTRSALDPGSATTSPIIPSGLPTGMVVAPPEDTNSDSMHPHTYSADDAGVTETEIVSALQPTETLSTVASTTTERMVAQQHYPDAIEGGLDAAVDIRGDNSGASVDIGGESTSTRGASIDTRSEGTDIRGASRYPTRLSSGSIPPCGAHPPLPRISLIY